MRGQGQRSHSDQYGQDPRPEEGQAQQPRCREVQPETYTADRVDKKSLAEFLGEVETYLSVLAPGLLARPLLEWAAAFRDQPIVMSDVETCEAAHGNPFDWKMKEVSEALGLLLHRRCKSQAQGSGED